jgi:hypothetical protein
MVWYTIEQHVFLYDLCEKSVVEGEIDQQLTLFSDEAWFHLQQHINTQKNRYWSLQNPHLTHEVLLHRVKFGILCALSARRIIIKPVFFLMKQLIIKEI